MKPDPDDRRARFAKVIKYHFSASEPVSNHELLRGRGDVLTTIERAFTTNGRHIFVFGDRGVGKTSLARSAATWHQPSELGLKAVQCEKANSAYAVMRDIASQILPASGSLDISRKVKFAIPGLSFEQTSQLATGTIPEFRSVNEAFAVIRKLASRYSDPPVVIIDEYHKLPTNENRETVAEFVRGVSDQEIPIRFIICGVAKTLDEMVSRDPSHGRFLKPLQLEPIPIDAREEILRAAALDLGLTLDRETVVRTAVISDGYPYYVKLIGEHLFWAMLDDPAVPSQSTHVHFEKALLGAAEDAEANFKEVYETATMKYKDEYAEVLWAFADDSMLDRKYDEVYATSYLPMMEERRKDPISLATFSSRVRTLCNDTHASILCRTRKGWYRFRENRLRGYIRLIAERNKVQLGSEHHLGRRRRRHWQEVA